MPIDLEDGLDRLYGVELAEFVGERTRLAAELRQEGRRAEAEQVKTLRKPSVSVWAVNQLARRRRQDVDLLLEAGHNLAAAQRGLLRGGDRQAFERAAKAERAALNRLSEGARSILAEHGSTAMLERAMSTLRAAALSDAARPDLMRGRLTSDVDPAGFGAFTGAPNTVSMPPKRTARPVQPVDSPTKRARVARQAAAKRAAIDDARAELRSAKERERRLAKKLREVEQAERAARTELERAERVAERAQADHEAAASVVEAAGAKLDRAER